MICRATRVLLLLALAATGCVNDEVPDRLIGTWMASSPSHQGRSIEISKERIIFNSDAIHSNFYEIHDIESMDRDGKLEYTIEYRGVGGYDRELNLRFYEGDPVAIELANQDGLWIRKNLITPQQKEAI